MCKSDTLSEWRKSAKAHRKQAYKQRKTYMEFFEQGSVGDASAVLLDGLPELLLCRIAIHRTDLEPAICRRTGHVRDQLTVVSK